MRSFIALAVCTLLMLSGCESRQAPRTAAEPGVTAKAASQQPVEGEFSREYAYSSAESYAPSADDGLRSGVSALDAAANIPNAVPAIAPPAANSIPGGQTAAGASPDGLSAGPRSDKLLEGKQGVVLAGPPAQGFNTKGMRHNPAHKTTLQGKDLGLADPSRASQLPSADFDEESLPPVPYPNNSETYDSIPENSFRRVAEAPLSTFSIDVDTASYSNLRRMLKSGLMPPAGAVRIEEMLNYFSYSYPQPAEEQPFAAQIEVAAAPWNARNRLVRIGLQSRALELEKRPSANLVFLIDVSGSMNSPDKLPLVQQSLAMLTEQLQARDRVAIVVYAGAAGLVLPSVPGDQHETILTAVGRLAAGGSTNGAGGIRQAYEVARQNFIKGAANRVVLATDGDFNVGVTSQSELVELIEREAKGGVFLSVLGFGTGNYKDSTLEKLADKGNGNYAYIDTIGEARKALVEQLAGTLVTVAKDVKIQIEFNPAQVASYRLIGYENRLLKKEDFNDDRKDAGEVGAGHAVTALYELTPVGEPSDRPAVDPLKYQPAAGAVEIANNKVSNDLLTLKLRYKAPDGDTTKLLTWPVKDSGHAFAQASADYQFASAVAAFGMLLRGSPHRGDVTYATVAEIAGSAIGPDTQGYRQEFLSLVKRAKQLTRDN